MLNAQQLAPLRKVSQRLYESMVLAFAAVNAGFVQAGIDPKGTFTVTPNINAINVTAANGIANIQIVDNSQTQNQNSVRPITYFVECATDSAFTNIVHHESKQATRNFNIFLGNQTLFFRAYSQLQGSPASTPINFGGTTPASVVCGGVAAPTQQTYQGSGTSTIGGQGYGLPPNLKNRKITSAADLP